MTSILGGYVEFDPAIAFNGSRYATVGAQALFSPAEISGNVCLWLDATDPATITFTPLTGRVSEWADKGPNGFNLTQPVGANQPITGTRTINNLNAVEFTGVSALGCLNLSLLDVRLLVLCVLVTDTLTNSIPFGYSDIDPADIFNNPNYNGFGVGGNGLEVHSAVGPASHRIFAEDSVTQFATGTTPIVIGTDYMVGWEFDRRPGQTSLAVWLNGVQEDVDTAVTPANRMATAGAIGAPTGVIGGAQAFDGAIGEIVSLVDPTTNERQLVEGYLAWKWGLQAGLPVGHPYRDSPPLQVEKPRWTPAATSDTYGWYDAAANGTVAAEAAPDSQLGVLDLATANGGINPITGQLWGAGDNYRLAFVTSAVIDATSADIAVYNAHAQAAAAAAGLGAVQWKAFVSTATVAAKDNTGLAAASVDSAVFRVDSVKVGDNIADLFDVAGSSGGPDNKIDRDEYGNVPPNLPPATPFYQYTPVWTGTDLQGNTSNPAGNATVNFAIAKAEKHFHWRRGQTAPTFEMHLYTVSELLTVITTVGTWLDRSGNDRHATADGSPGMTYFRNAGPNGKSFLRSYVAGPTAPHFDIPVDLSGDHMVFILGDVDPAVGSQGVFSTDEAAGANRYSIQRAFEEVLAAGTAGPTLSGLGASVGWTIFGLVCDGTAGTKTAYKNGTQVGQNAYTAVDGPTIAHLWRCVGEAPSGRVGEYVIVTGTSSVTRQLVEGYLAWKWGFAGNLPNDHPYKSEPPRI